MYRTINVASFVLASLLMAALPGVAHSQSRRSVSSATVTACSQYGKGCVTGAVRQGRVEQEVRMPGGTWIGCKRDCRQTLREETVDFFETLRDRAPDQHR